MLFPQITCFQGGTGELKASPLRDYLDLPELLTLDSLLVVLKDSMLSM